MGIPKVIHYCWFGKNPLPQTAVKCINSWKKFCPDYEIIQWNEENFDVLSNRYMAEAYQAGQWAFVSDYARLKIIYEHGGIYFDTDVQVVKPLDSLLNQTGFMGFQDSMLVASGLGFGAVKGHPVIQMLLQDYDDISFLKGDGTFDQTPCPDRNTSTLVHLGLRQNTSDIQNIKGMLIYPSEYFCPMDYHTGEMRKTVNTYSIHHFDSSWFSTERKKIIIWKRRKVKLKKIIGPQFYDFLERAWHFLKN